MLITLVTYNRPEWAHRIIKHLRAEAPTATVAVCNNGGLRPEPSSPWLDVTGSTVAGVDRPYGAPGRTIVFNPPTNLGGGGGRNELLKLRRPGEPFVRIDDDWLPKKHGWLARAQELAKESRSGLIRVGPDRRMEDRLPPPAAGQWRSPDCCGPIWLVTGRCADALGAFYLGFGKTLLDDLEYSRRAAEWQKRFQGKRRVFEFGWPIEELGAPGTPWLPPWELFLARVKRMQRPGFDLLVPFTQDTPGWEQRAAGLSDQEHE